MFKMVKWYKLAKEIIRNTKNKRNIYYSLFKKLEKKVVINILA
jgi:hypothetical protein